MSIIKFPDPPFERPNFFKVDPRIVWVGRKWRLFRQDGTAEALCLAQIDDALHRGHVQPTKTNRRWFADTRQCTWAAATPDPRVNRILQDYEGHWTGSAAGWNAQCAIRFPVDKTAIWAPTLDTRVRQESADDYNAVFPQWQKFFLDACKAWKENPAIVPRSRYNKGQFFLAWTAARAGLPHNLCWQIFHEAFEQRDDGVFYHGKPRARQMRHKHDFEDAMQAEAVRLFYSVFEPNNNNLEIVR